jgi:hypothetical protein
MDSFDGADAGRAVCERKRRAHRENGYVCTPDGPVPARTCRRSGTPPGSRSRLAIAAGLPRTDDPVVTLPEWETGIHMKPPDQSG